MKNLILFSITLLLAGFASCDKGAEKKETTIDCNKLKSALIIYDNEIISGEISKITAKLIPISSKSDVIGHRNNFDIFVDNLNDCVGLKAELLCYACIKTYPAQTEILITVDSVGNQVKRTIDILTPKESCLSYKGIHEFASNNIRLKRTIYSGCFNSNSKVSLKNSPIDTDTLYYTIANDTLTLSIVKNYNCCGQLIDSVVINKEEVNVFIADTCVDLCECKCMCNFGFDYKLTEFWQKNTLFNVYIKGLHDTSYKLWRNTKFIDG